jgi:hypothetical protein
MRLIYNLHWLLHKADMDCAKSLSDRRALALATALLAITLNFLQPLVHAALMRDGAPATLWSVFCNATPDMRSNTGQDVPLAQDKHECCLGLAHAVAFTSPAAIFTPIERVAATVRPLATFDQLTPVGIRDGPHQPRGPPSFV